MCFQVGKETTKTAMQMQKSSTSWDSVGTALEEVSTEKPETRSGCLSNQAGAIHQKQQSTTTKRYAIALAISEQHIHNLLHFKVQLSRKDLIFAFVCVVV